MKGRKWIVGFLLLIMIALVPMIVYADDTITPLSIVQPYAGRDSSYGTDTYEIKVEEDANVTFVIEKTDGGTGNSCIVQVTEIVGKTTGTIKKPGTYLKTTMYSKKQTHTYTLPPDTYTISVTYNMVGYSLQVTGYYLPYTTVEKLNLVEGETAEIPINRTNGLTASWTTQSNSVASVDSYGKVTANGYGTTKVTCLMSDGTKIEVPVTVIALMNTEHTMKVGASYSLSLQPYSLKDEATWSSSDEKVATVTNGKVTAISPGTTIITAQVEGYSPLKATITVSEVTISESSLNLKIGETRLVILDEIDYGASISWVSDNPSIASVSTSGYSSLIDKDRYITAEAPGTTTIRVTINDAFSLTIDVTVEGATLEPSSLSMKLGQESEISLAGTQLDSSDLTWVVSNPKVAKVTGDSWYGNKWKVVALNPGSAKVTLKKGNAVLGTVKVKVKSVKVSPTKLTVGVKEKAQISIKGMYDYANPKLVWKSSNKKIATVNSEGVVTGKKAGTCNITVKINGGKTYTTKVTVVPSMSKTEEDVAVGETVKIKLNGAGKEKITWSSSNPSIATVSDDGVVTAGNTLGKVTVTAKCGKTKMKCVVNVRPKLTITVNRITDTAIYNEVYVTFHNYSNKKIVYTTLNFTQYNNAGVLLESPYDYYYLNETIKPKGSITNWEYWVNGDTKSVTVTLTDVTFSDGTHWKP